MKYPRYIQDVLLYETTQSAKALEFKKKKKKDN